jgi:DNA polymerase elongation subunit (family B)
MPFILLSKKRYVGTLYEEDPNKGKLKYMGLVLKRRDNCDLVKDVYGGVLDILMGKMNTNTNTNTNNVKLSIEFLKKSLNELIEGKVPMEKLTITKALRSYYKNPQQIAHSVLAQRIGKRDPGNKPKPGDRIKYAHIVVNPTVGMSKKLLQGDKIETPEYIHDNKLTLDYTHYITNQLMKPLQQLFGLALEQIWESQGKYKPILEYKKDMQRLEGETANLEEFMKKKEKYCSAKVKTLLFDTFLTKIFQKENGIQTLETFFSKISL